MPPEPLRLVLDPSAPLHLVISCPRCSRHIQLPGLQFIPELTVCADSSQLGIRLSELPAVSHDCADHLDPAIPGTIDQDPQPPFIDRGGVGFSTPSVTDPDQFRSRSSSPAAPNPSTSRSTTASGSYADSRSSRDLYRHIKAHDHSYWTFIREIRARVNLEELTIDLVLETAESLIDEYRRAEREAARIPVQSAHPAGRALRVVPNQPTECSGFVPSPTSDPRTCQICLRPLTAHQITAW